MQMSETLVHEGAYQHDVRAVPRRGANVPGYRLSAERFFPLDSVDVERALGGTRFSAAPCTGQSLERLVAGTFAPIRAGRLMRKISDRSLRGRSRMQDRRMMRITEE